MIVAGALLALGTPGHAQSVLSPGRHQLVAQGSDGWTWYLVKDSRRAVKTGDATVHGFWMTGVNAGSIGGRFSKVEVKLVCAGAGWYVPTHVTLYDASKRVLRDMLTGDDAANWTKVLAGNPMDGARRFICG